MYREPLPVALAVALMAITAGTGTGAWAGKEITKDGVPHVMNPATPSEGAITMAPKEVWSVGGDDEEDVLLGVVTAIDVDSQGNVYALDMQLSQVHIFDKNGNLVRTIGREGEGPGEFRRANMMFLTPEGNVAVLQQMPGKLVLLTPDGKPAGDFPGPKGGDGGMIAYFEGGRAGDGIVLGTREFVRQDTKFNITRALLLMSARGETRATLFKNSDARDMATMMNMDEKAMRMMVWAGGKDGRVYTSENFDGYQIKVHSPAGKLERVIEREYTHRQRSKQEMEDNKPRVVMRRNDQRVKPEIKSSTTDRDILRMFPREDGSLWVMSSKGGNDQPKGTMATFDVFDTAGHFVRTVAMQVPGDFDQDEFYLIRDQLVVVRSARSARDAFDGAEDETATPAADVEPVSVVAYRLEAPTTAARK